jgi:hypothetical protein
VPTSTSSPEVPVIVHALGPGAPVGELVGVGHGLEVLPGVGEPLWRGEPLEVGVLVGVIVCCWTARAPELAAVELGDGDDEGLGLAVGLADGLRAAVGLADGDPDP